VSKREWEFAEVLIELVSESEVGEVRREVIDCPIKSVSESEVGESQGIGLGFANFGEFVGFNMKVNKGGREIFNRLRKFI
jgi:hypothetical protein